MRLAAIAALGCAACSSQGLVLEADPGPFAADGVTVVELRAQVSFRGSAVADGTDVAFTADQEVLFETRADTEPRVTGGRAAGEAAVETSTAGGEARAYVLLPTTGGELEVVASYTTVNRDVLAATVVLPVGPPPLVSAGTGACGDLQDARSYLDLRCGGASVANIGAFVSGRPEIQIDCELTALDAAGRALPNTPVELYAEAGSFVDEPATTDRRRTITYVVPAAPSILPRDVEPMDDEVSLGLWLPGAQLLPGAAEQNPRDGLVTLLVVARGQEAFEDANGNGRWDDGECYQDEGEPFVDMDDDGVYSAADGPSRGDIDGNGRWDGPNGRFDADRPIGRLSHVLWTGPIFADPYRAGIRSDDGTYGLAALGQAHLTVRAVDANFNPVAALDAGDEIDLVIAGEPSRKVDFIDPPDPDEILVQTAGLTLVTWPRVLFDGQQVVFDHIADECPAGLCGRDWGFFIGDSRTPADSTLASCYTWSVEASVRYTPVDAGLARQVASLSVNGRLDNLDGTCP